MAAVLGGLVQGMPRVCQPWPRVTYSLTFMGHVLWVETVLTEIKVKLGESR